MSEVMAALERELTNREVTSFRVGDTVKVHVKVREGDKERIQLFQGVVIARHNASNRSSFTVRKVSAGVGVERVFPLYSPQVAAIELVKRAKVRRAKLYYLRELRGKAARLRETREVARA